MFSKKMIVKIDGMHCDHCAKSVRDGLLSISSIKNVKVDLSKKQAVISYKDTVDLKEVETVISNLGFQYLGVEE